jgi:hypothetical protein
MGHVYKLSPTGNAATDTAAMDALIDRIPANAKATVVIRDNGQPLRLGVVGGSAINKSIVGKSIFFRGETPNARIVWGVGAGTGSQGLYSINYGGFTSPLRLADAMPSNVTRVAMGAAGIDARFSVLPSPNVALTRGDHVLVWADGPQIADVGPHHRAGSQRSGELHRVQWGSGTNYTLDNYVHDAMTVNPRVAKIVPIQNCGFADLIFSYEGSTSRATQYNYLDIRYTYGFVLENIRVDETGVGTIFTHCNDGMRISGYDLRHMQFASDYGIIDNVNRNLLVEDMYTRFLRHLHTTGGYVDYSKQWTLERISVSSGTYVLNLNGSNTSSIAYDATAATVQTALEAIAGVGNIFVQQWAGSGVTIYTISVAGTLLTNNNTLTLNGATQNVNNADEFNLSLGGGTMRYTRGVARYGNSRGTQIRNCKASVGGLSTNAVQYGFDTHAEGVDVTYRNCIVEMGVQDDGNNGSIGFSVRSRGQKFYDCQVLGNRVYTSVTRSVHRGWQQAGGSGAEWHRCRAAHLWHGIDFNGDFYGVNQDNFLINDSTFERCTGCGVRSIAADTGFGAVDNIRIENSRFFNNGESVGASTRGAAIHIIRGSGHKVRNNHIDRDVNRYSLSFEGLASSALDITGNSLRNYGNFGASKMGIRGQSGDPHGASEGTADGIQSAFGSMNYTTA